MPCRRLPQVRGLCSSCLSLFSGLNGMAEQFVGVLPYRLVHLVRYMECEHCLGVSDPGHRSGGQSLCPGLKPTVTFLPSPRGGPILYTTRTRASHSSWGGPVLPLNVQPSLPPRRGGKGVIVWQREKCRTGCGTENNRRVDGQPVSHHRHHLRPIVPARRTNGDLPASTSTNSDGGGGGDWPRSFYPGASRSSALPAWPGWWYCRRSRLTVD